MPSHNHAPKYNTVETTEAFLIYNAEILEVSGNYMVCMCNAFHFVLIINIKHCV